MNKTIIISLALIAAVGVIATGATISYFSDTETSLGNTFTAGSIDLKIDSKCHFNGLDCIAHATNGKKYWDTDKSGSIEAGEAYANNECNCNWSLVDLTTEEFFNFIDLKPGDRGENTISLHVINNNAWACMTVTPTLDDDIDCTDPECVYEGGSWDGTNCTGGTCQDSDPSATFDGELGANLKFFAWYETDGDNIYETGETPLEEFGTQDSETTHSATSTVTYTIADSSSTYNTNGITGCNDFTNCKNHVGMAWCAGTMTVVASGDGTNKITCSGSSMENDCQSDKYQATVSLKVEQHRNNSSFTCN